MAMTKGPLYVDPKKPYHVLNEQGQTVVFTGTRFLADPLEKQANARAIAELPNLIEVLEELVDNPEEVTYCNYCNGSSSFLSVLPVEHFAECPMERAQTILAKLKGESNG